MAAQLPEEPITENPTSNYLKSDGVLQAEVSKFEYKRLGKVDFRGDLNLSVPVLTVPGRGGLDFPISLSYKSGIKGVDRATWVGLGWTLNEGYISRLVNFYPDLDSTRNGSVMRRNALKGDSLPENSDSYVVNLPHMGSHIILPMESVDNSFKTSPPLFVFQDWKNWRISYEIGSFKVSRRIVTTGNCPDLSNHVRIVEEFDCFWDQDWFTSSKIQINQAYCVKENTWYDSVYNDIAKITVTADDGIRYVFSLPLKSDILIDKLYEEVSLPQGGSGWALRLGIVMEYVSNWRLTQILSSDYVDVNSNGVPDNADSGNWIRFYYNYPYNGQDRQVRDIRPYYNVRTAINGDLTAMLTQTTYLSKIETPTHYAEFKTSPRKDISYLAPFPNQIGHHYTQFGTIGDFSAGAPYVIKPLRLDRIELYEKVGLTLVQTAEFEYAPLGSELCKYDPTYPALTYVIDENSNQIDLTNVGKTTLKRVYSKDASGNQLPGYTFSYTEVDNFNPNYYGIETSGTQTVRSPAMQVLENSESTPFLDNGIYRSRTDRMGYYFGFPDELTNYPAYIRDTYGAVAWSLRKIEYPTGAIETIDYDHDRFQYDTDKSNSLLPQTTGALNLWRNYPNDGSECGIRVRSIAAFDPITNVTTTVRYEFGNGHLPGLPMTYLRNYSPQTGGGVYFTTVFDWSTNEVEYEWMAELSDDNSKTIYTYYSATDDGNAYYNHQEISLINYIAEWPYWHLNSIDKSWLRGKTKSIARYNAAGQTVHKEDYTYAQFKVAQNLITYRNQTFRAQSWKTHTTAALQTVYEQAGGNPISKSTTVLYSGDGRVTERREDGVISQTLKSKLTYLAPSDVWIPNSTFQSGSEDWTITPTSQYGGSSYQFANGYALATTGSSYSQSKGLTLSILTSGYIPIAHSTTYSANLNAYVDLFAATEGCSGGGGSQNYRGERQSLFRFASYTEKKAAYDLTGTASANYTIKVYFYDDNFSSVATPTNYQVNRSINTTVNNPEILRETINYASPAFSTPENCHFVKLEVIVNVSGNGSLCVSGQNPEYYGTASSYLYDVSIKPVASDVAALAYAKNQKSLISNQKLFDNSTLKKFTELSYKNFGSTGAERIYLEFEKIWRDDNQNGIVESSELINSTQINQVDDYGNPTLLTDANGIQATLQWGHIASSKLTQWTKGPLTRQFTYNLHNLITTIRDENNQITTYQYDGFRRLIRITGPDSKVLKEYDYHYRNQ
jgi:YD repeat-containing protein